MKSYTSAIKNCTPTKSSTPLKLNFFTEIMLDPQLFKVPPDVVLLGQENGMVGLMDWPTYTHQEVIDVIDLLPTHCTEDYDRVILLQKIINFINFLY